MKHRVSFKAEKESVNLIEKNMISGLHYENMIGISHDYSSNMHNVP